MFRSDKNSGCYGKENKKAETTIDMGPTKVQNNLVLEIRHQKRSATRRPLNSNKKNEVV